MILSQSVLKVNPKFDHKSFRSFRDSVERAVHTLNFKITDYFLEHAWITLLYSSLSDQDQFKCTIRITKVSLLFGPLVFKTFLAIVTTMHLVHSGPVGSDDLLSVLLDEFPYLHLSTETLQDLWRKSTQQFERLANAEREVRRRKSKAQVQVWLTIFIFMKHIFNYCSCVYTPK